MSPLLINMIFLIISGISISVPFTGSYSLYIHVLINHSAALFSSHSTPSLWEILSTITASINICVLINSKYLSIQISLLRSRDTYLTIQTNILFDGPQSSKLNMCIDEFIIFSPNELILLRVPPKCSSQKYEFHLLLFPLQLMCIPTSSTSPYSLLFHCHFSKSGHCRLFCISASQPSNPLFVLHL